MIRHLVLAALAFMLLPQTALAQSPFSNPFADAATYRAARGDTSGANYRARFEETITEGTAAPRVSEVIIDVAPDWALVRRGDVATLYDFRLNRVITITGDSFTSMNGLGLLAFRVMERQNRAYLQRTLAQIGPQANTTDACDAEAELAIVFPGDPNAGAVAWRERRGVQTLRCADRDIGSFTAGDGAAAPAALWTAIYAEMPVHPALHRRMRDTGRAPARLESSYRQMTGGAVRRTWRLIAVESRSTDYPLTTNLTNTTAAMLDGITPGVGAVAVEAIDGRANGGAPTSLADWDADLRALAQSEGEAAAAMLATNGFNMYPEVQCAPGSQVFLCELTTRLRALDDPGPWAVFEVGIAEQSNDMGAAIAAMQRAQASRYRDHPALGAAYALAVIRFNDENRAQARAAGLSTDVRELQRRAIVALPYNPAYWTDAADFYAANYEWPTAFLFFDIAHSLPMPNALANSRVLAAKRGFAERIRTDFPDATLTRG